ncbi:hypothetical protein KC333_g224 [Hortaea werneckii]|nr:hypothetical protein KC333_g224 [Hortaea werneckii]
MNGNGDTISFANALGGSVHMHQNILGWENGMQPFHISGIGMTPEVGASEFTFDPALYQDNAVTFENPFDPIAASVATTETVPKVASVHNRHDSSMEPSPLSQAAHLPINLNLPFDTTSGEPSLDNQASSNAQVVGMSGESDPYLLARYRYDQYNEASFQSLRMRKMNSGPSEDGSIPSFFPIQHNALASKAQPVERSEVMDKYRSEVEEMVGEEVGKRLIRLFYKDTMSETSAAYGTCLASRHAFWLPSMDTPFLFAPGTRSFVLRFIHHPRQMRSSALLDIAVACPAPPNE